MVLVVKGPVDEMDEDQDLATEEMNSGEKKHPVRTKGDLAPKYRRCMEILDKHPDIRSVKLAEKVKASKGTVNGWVVARWANPDLYKRLNKYYGINEEKSASTEPDTDLSAGVFSWEHIKLTCTPEQIVEIARQLIPWLQDYQKSLRSQAEEVGCILSCVPPK